jgi:hypothetical protein
MVGTPTRQRRIVRSLVLVVVAPLLLIAGYISTWLVVSRAARENLIGSNTALNLRPAFAPLIRFCDTEYPGGVALNGLWWRVNPRHVVHKNGMRIEFATSALALAPSDLPRRAAMGEPRSFPQPVAMPRPVARNASAMRR